MFDRFTERARKTIIVAKEEALRLWHPALDCEHLLLGILHDESSVGIHALQKSGVKLDDLRADIYHRLGNRGLKAQKGDIPFTPAAKEVLRLAIELSRELGHYYVGTEHLLLGILREGENIAAMTLQDHGVAEEQLTGHILGLLGESRKHGRNKNSGQKLLTQFGTDLTELAEQGALDPVIGRDEEITRIVRILSRRTKNNPILLGEPGVGKTAIVEGLAQRIVDGDAPEVLHDKTLMSLDLAGVVAGTMYRGQFEERLKGIMKELIASERRIIVFIDEIHTLMGAGSAQGSLDASSMLKPALSRGDIQCIGATTLDEHRKHIEKDSALARRFQTVHITQPDREDTVDILKGLRETYEDYHKVCIPDSSIQLAVRLSEQYITDRFFPDKAIDVIDEASSLRKLQRYHYPGEVLRTENMLREIMEKKHTAVWEGNFRKVAELRDREREIRQRLADVKQLWEQQQIKSIPLVSDDDIARVVSKWTGIPLTKIEENETEKLLRMEDELHRRVIGQDEAIEAVSRAIRRSRTGIKDAKRPSGIFMFLGPTGVGKTELSRALSEYLFGRDSAMIRVDMSEYIERHTVSRLIGAPPGYIGYDEGGQLTEKVRRTPYSIVLFDEIEKAHPDVLNILLQIMEDGQLTDSYGRVVDFRNTVIIMTSNVGAKMLQKRVHLGFHQGGSTVEHQKMKERVSSELKRAFNPEFLNRIDEVITFHALQPDHIHDIVDVMIDQVNAQLKDNGLNTLHIQLSGDAKRWLAERGYDEIYGARPLRRLIQSSIEDMLAEELLNGCLQDCDTIRIVVREDGELGYLPPGHLKDAEEQNYDARELVLDEAVL
ncbi:ATP-dependent Clp protease ATP-binding subunit ClpC [candidate division KSB3 bacterium]|uniref:ATP-dependent Clp protease ATP-binding subunit ClpC n=1 Tax=candidate division KSB3 bacterium TaxID=2044937 RepID=A0A2G6E486_9BACT|nr:MAG: ATP-dependent Clp protease ATP-binding subunit ClpC [candidate division KSB3 bacterium]PIE29476.1 MAG: ATP-dependent Clp protease ATP-binding subunit ClpC [candidate division KSB3 bacterium]